MTGKPIVLALDLSTRVGWAVGRDRETPLYGVIDLGRMSSGLGRIFSCLAASVENMIAVHQPDAVIFEAPLPQQARDTQQIARLLIGLAAVTEMVCFEKGIDPTEEFPKNVRKLVMGNGSVNKAAIMEWCHAQGWKPQDDNAGDALVLLRYKHTLSRMKIMAGAGSV